MPTPRPAPLCQVRVIATARDAAALLAHLTEQARRRFGSTATYHTQARSARRTGHVRVYLTITPKEATVRDRNST
jgi:hypothetical protein